MEVLRALKDETLCADVTAAFSTQEEVGLRGAKITAERLRPALAICLEGTPADDNFTAPDEAQGALKKGVQIRFRDGSMVAHPGLVAFARRVAEENNIPHQCAVRTGGGTNGGSIHLAPGGVPTLVLGIPVRYAHTHYGYSAAADVDAAIALTCAILRAYARRDAPSAQPPWPGMLSNKAQCNDREPRRRIAKNSAACS